MKAQLYDIEGTKKGTIELPKIFETKIREDIVAKYFEADKFIQPYAAKQGAGLRQSASGTISHKRHDWKGHYGRGISRVPRKTMSRRGTQFLWIGANIPGARGGRKAHPPKGVGKEKKINKKEIKIAFNSALAATANQKFIIKRYKSLEKIDAPFVLEKLPGKTKFLIKTLNQILGEASNLALKHKNVRAGKGKLRGRKYKSNAGALIIVSKDERKHFKGVEVKSADTVSISDLYPLGRLTIYTQKAINELAAEKK